MTLSFRVFKVYRVCVLNESIDTVKDDLYAIAKITALNTIHVRDTHTHK